MGVGTFSPASAVEGDDIVPAAKPPIKKQRPLPETPTIVPMTLKTALAVMGVLTIIFVALAATYNYSTPFHTPVQLQVRDGGAANPDEPAHYLYVQSIAAGKLPVFSDTSQDYEAHQPPLYYALTAPLAKITSGASEETRAHAIRWAATIFGICLLWAIFGATLTLYPNAPLTAVFTAALASFLPMNLSLSASIGNDTLTNLIFVLALWQLIRAARLRLTPSVDPIGSNRWLREAALLGVILGVGIWTKSSTLLLFPTVLVAFAVFATRGLTIRDAALGAVVSCGVGGLIGLPWLLRNLALYHDPLAQTVVFGALAARNVRPDQLIQAFGGTWYLNRMVGWTFDSYWGVFDSMTLFLPKTLYLGLALLTITAAIGFVFYLRRREDETFQKAMLAVFGVLTVLTLYAFIQYNQHFFQAQGRYFYPALLPLSLIAALGSISFVPAHRRIWLVAATIAALVLLNGYCLAVISGHYAA